MYQALHGHTDKEYVPRRGATHQRGASDIGSAGGDSHENGGRYRDNESVGVRCPNCGCPREVVSHTQVPQICLYELSGAHRDKSSCSFASLTAWGTGTQSTSRALSARWLATSPTCATLSRRWQSSRTCCGDVGLGQCAEGWVSVLRTSRGLKNEKINLVPQRRRDSCLSRFGAASLFFLRPDQLGEGWATCAC